MLKYGFESLKVLAYVVIKLIINTNMKVQNIFPNRCTISF